MQALRTGFAPGGVAGEVVDVPGDLNVCSTLNIEYGLTSRGWKYAADSSSGSK